MIFKISEKCGGPETVWLFLYVSWGCNVIEAYVMNNWWFSSWHWYMLNGWQTSLPIFFPCFPYFILCCVLVLCCCDLVGGSLSRSLLLACFNMKRQIQTQVCWALPRNKRLWLFTTLSNEMSNFSYYKNDVPQHRAWKQIIIQEHETELTCTGACHEHFPQQITKVIAVRVQSKEKGWLCSLDNWDWPLFTHLAHKNMQPSRRVPFQGCWSVTSLLIVGTPHFTLPSLIRHKVLGYY